MNSNIGINTNDIDPKIDVHMGVHSVHLAPYVNGSLKTVQFAAERLNGMIVLSAQSSGATFGPTVTKLKNASLSGLFAHQKLDSPMPISTAIQLIQQGALGRAFEETAQRERRAKGVKKVAGPRGLISWPSTLKVPGNPFSRRK